MEKTQNIYDVLRPERVKTWLQAAFIEAGVTSVAALKDDKKVERIAQMTYEKIPLIPFRAAIKAAIGKDGFIRVIFAMRDKMLEAESIDLSWLNPDYLKSILTTAGSSSGNELERDFEPELEETPKSGSMLLFHRIGDFAPTGIMVVNADGTELRQLLPWGESPKWSPDGKHIAFSGCPSSAKRGGMFSKEGLLDPDFMGENSEIYLVNGDGTNLNRLTYTQSAGSSTPIWSPDCSKLAFLRTSESISQVWLMNCDGTEQEQLTVQENHMLFCWTLDGKIVFERFGAGIRTIDPENKYVERLAIFEDGDSTPAWSHDGKMVVFCRGPDIYVMNADGSNKKQLAEGWDPSWSPDGHWIAFCSNKRTKWGREIFIIRKDGKCEKRLTDTTPPKPDKEVDDWGPYWLPGAPAPRYQRLRGETNKYGWEWKSEEAAERYTRILAERIGHGGAFGGKEALPSFIRLADELVEFEGHIPDSFIVAVDLGMIYSTAAMMKARHKASGDLALSDEWMAKANEAWSLASKYIEKGLPKDPDFIGQGALRTTYMGGYWQIPCQIGFAKYLRTDCKDISYLREMRAYWENASREDPNNAFLQIVGEQVRKKLPGGEPISQAPARSRDSQAERTQSALRSSKPKVNLQEIGFVNELGDKPPDCVLAEPLERHMDNASEYSSVVLALSFDSGPAAHPTAKSYVFYFFREEVDRDRPPDDILTFKVKLSKREKVHIVDKYLGGMTFGAENAPPLSKRHLYKPGEPSEKDNTAIGAIAEQLVSASQSAAVHIDSRTARPTAPSKLNLALVLLLAVACVAIVAYLNSKPADDKVQATPAYVAPQATLPSQQRPSHSLDGNGSKPEQHTPSSNGQGLEHVRIMLFNAMGDDGGVDKEMEIIEAKNQIERLPRPIRGNRKAARAANDRGLNYLQTGKRTEAVNALMQAHSEDPADVEILNNLGYAYLVKGELDSAERYMLSAISLAPARAAAWTNLGQTYAKKGDTRSAVASFANAYRFSRDRNKTHRFFLDLMKKEDDSRVVAALQQITQLAQDRFVPMGE